MGCPNVGNGRLERTGGERVKFRSDPASIRGSMAPVVTPFTADGELDTEGLRSLVRW